MSKICKVKDILIGEGIPKICVPVISDNHQSIITDLIRLKDLEIDLIELRIDYFKELSNRQKLIELFKQALIKERCLEVIFIYEENCIPLKHEYNFDRNKDFSYDFLVEFGVDLAIVYYWNHLIPKQILDEICFFNIHPSMLPKYRGPHPVIFQLLNKEKYLGVTMHKMDETYDTGEIFLQESVEIDYDNIRFLDIKIFRIAKKMIIQLINDYRSGSIVLTKQLDGDATYFSSNDLSCILNNEIYYG